MLIENNGLNNAGYIISDMLNEGYEIDEIKIGDNIIKKPDIMYIDFMKHYISITFNDEKIMFMGYDKVDWIILKECDE